MSVSVILLDFDELSESDTVDCALLEREVVRMLDRVGEYVMETLAVQDGLVGDCVSESVELGVSLKEGVSVAVGSDDELIVPDSVIDLLEVRLRSVVLVADFEPVRPEALSVDDLDSGSLIVTLTVFDNKRDRVCLSDNVGEFFVEMVLNNETDVVIIVDGDVVFIIEELLKLLDIDSDLEWVFEALTTILSKGV